jgi:DNA-binding response OmpR family regulator
LYCRPEIKHNRYEKNCSIFIVDDELDTLESLRIVLEEENFKVEAFTDPAVALDRYVPGSYDLLILDIKLIGMNGFDLYKNIKRKDPDVTTCFLTALSDLNDYQIYKNEVYLQFVERHFIFKPIENGELLCIIRTLIEQRLYKTGNQETKFGTPLGGI